MTWSIGMMLVAGLMVVVWVGAEIVDEDRKDLRRLRKLERARLHWEAKIIEDQAFWRKDAP